MTTPTGQPLKISELPVASSAGAGDILLVNKLSGGEYTTEQLDAANLTVAAANLNGTSLPSNVVGSSLTSVGTITTGVWHGTAVGTGYGGLGADNSAASGVPLFTAGAVAMTGTSGTGNFARVTSPTFVTPTLGAATATSINGNAITAGTGTLTIGAGKTLTVSKSLTVNGTDGTTLIFPSTSATIARTDAGQTFTGTQAFGAITYSSLNGNTWASGTGTLSIGASKTFTASNTVTLTATDGSTLAIGAGGTLGSNAYTSTAYAPLVSPTFTGTPAAPTPAANDSSTKLATTAHVYSKPYLAVSLSATQTGVGNTSHTKVNLDSVLFDSNSWWDASNKRYTPQLAGKYRASGAVFFVASAMTVCLASIYKTGAAYAQVGMGITSASFSGVVPPIIVSLNGSTDYIELFGLITAASGQSFLGGTAPNFTYLEIEYIGP